MNMEKAKAFLIKNARPLDMARWNYLFEHGDKTEVLKILSYYQNSDGGFGHGLEPDCLNPISSPMTTAVAINIIKEVGLADEEHPIITGILDYLSSGKNFDGTYWSWSIPSNNDYPHAPWWDASYGQLGEGINPSATLAGFIVKFAHESSYLYGIAKKTIKSIFYCLKNDKITSMHCVKSVCELYDYLIECNVTDIVDMVEFTLYLGKAISKCLQKDTSKWGAEYSCKPSLFISNKYKYSPFYQMNKALCDAECKFIESTQKPDGTWDVTWSWDAYPEEWHISKNFWKSDIIINNLKFLRSMK